MNYANWLSREELLKFLTPVNLNTKIKKSGIPMMFDDKNLYIDDKEAHTLVIGSTGSGKTQTTILPVIKLAMLAGESFILNDVHGDIYESTAKKLEESGYKVWTIAFDKPIYGNNWNPLAIPYKLYSKDNTDMAIKMLEDLGYYLIAETQEIADPFWVNSTIDFFTGLALYIFENGAYDEINLNSIYSIANKLNDKEEIDLLLKRIDKNSNIYYNLSGTLNAPVETRGSIISVFNQKMKKYLSRENLANMLSASDFDLSDISHEKTAIFMIGGNATYTNNLIPLFVNQVFDTISILDDNKRMINILLDEFDTMIPIKDFTRLIDYSRSINIRFTVVIKSYINLINVYGKENAEIIKMCFGNIIYLLSNDIYTLEEISKMCGNQTVDGIIKPLITVEELKVMQYFEAIILLPRMMPYRGKLLPDYEIDWGYKNKNAELLKRKVNNIKIFDSNLK